MRTVVVTEPGKVEVHTVADPVLPGPAGAIVEVETSAICGSDLHFYDGDLPLFPVAAGHEAVGRVVEVGAEVRRFRPGQRVLVASVAGCGDCVGCADGDPVTCVAGGKVFGAGELGGAQSDLLAVPAADFNLLAVPDGVDDEAALLLTDNLGTGWVAAQRAGLAPGGTAVVLGLGAVGQCAVRSAFLLGAGRVLAVDPVPGRRARAEDSGAVGVAAEDVTAAILDLTDGRGADAVIDAVAKDTSLDTAFATVRAGGTVSVVGVHDLAPYPLPILMGVFRSVTLAMTTAPVHRTWTDLVPLVRHGRLDTTGIFTHEFRLDDAAAAYAAVAARTPDCMKVKLLP
ncbi:2-desacetyl-2-hydroxyethyl bacteriochlorophyllide A dehydrogenase [Actinocorallia herbida]|uniref:2-desacetyl-2-hydroxyethyl bacteriochlorophyllide A dehydrogenase n=1 Tax=Actinocorallia herbida TaxID=58109 RepID=A0A3N1D036_9ACTN|nr:alcohol dehydrogenase catalytic domain-containing protein [Actinocorallia herbida]ROO86890.1 2-desacetyl-2-hydroxyethyl bacteriochlorophyllide A dehydrogenase [Actinocorallia herbida]